MKTFVQPGRSITVAAPAGGVSSGDGVLIGNLFGSAQGDALATEDVEILTEGVAEIAKTSALAISVGDRLFWDGTNKVVNTIEVTVDGKTAGTTTNGNGVSWTFTEKGTATIALKGSIIHSVEKTVTAENLTDVVRIEVSLKL